VPEQDRAALETRVAPAVDASGVWLTTADDVAVDVLIDGRRIWSFNPSQAAQRDADTFFVPWPDPLRRFLDGVGQVSVREHVSEKMLFDAEIRFGDSDSRLKIEDSEGRPLVFNKHGKVKRSFEERDPVAADAMMRAADAALALVHKAGYPAFLAYGTLLGAVRDGRLIGHDDDIDLAFVADSPFPVDAARSSFQLERMFRRAGWATWRFSAGDFKVADKRLHGPGRWMDIFGGWYADGRFYLLGRLAIPEDEVKLLPLSEVELEGHRLAAPADPTWLLEAAYGPNWRIPDPSFKAVKLRSTTRRMRSWMRGAIANRDHWFSFYGAKANAVPTTPSAFASWFAERERPGPRVVDLGCGNGRDSLWLAEQGYDVLGVDYAPGAVRLARNSARSRGVDAEFETVNLLDTRHVLTLGGLLSHEPAPVHLYGRFLLHSLTDRGRHNLWLLARTALRKGGRLYLEFLADQRRAADVTHFFGEHFRRPLRPRAVAAEIRAMGGRVEHREAGRGRAVFHDEDPYICRIVASWPRTR
jgi:SAM-dependent methyltransferase